MGEIIFDGVSSRDVGIVVEHPPKYTIPEKEYIVTHVPGKNGDEIIDPGSFKNVTGSYDIAFGSYVKNHSEMASAVSEWLCAPSGYCRLEDSYDMSCYRMGYFSSNLDLENILNHLGRATIEFTCMPQKFLKNGERSIYVDYLTNSKYDAEFSSEGSGYERVTATFTNPTRFEARPLIKITTGQISEDEIGKTYSKAELAFLNRPNVRSASRPAVYLYLSPTVASNKTAYLDLETKQVCDVYGEIIPNYFVWEDDQFRMFPSFGLGTNEISYYTDSDHLTIGIKSLEVTPRWWKI